MQDYLKESAVKLKKSIEDAVTMFISEQQIAPKIDIQIDYDGDVVNCRIKINVSL